MHRKLRLCLKANHWIALWLTALAILLVMTAYSAEWTGFPGKLLWDWLDLLIVPAVIAAGAFWFERRQRQREQESQDAQRARELEIEEQRAQDAALEAYQDRMGQLLLDRNLLNQAASDEVRTLARAYTLTVLGRLNAERKSSVLRFLRDANLIKREHPIVSLNGADLTNAHLSRMLLIDTNLNGAFLNARTFAGPS